MTRKRKRLWALLLSAALVTTQLPAVVLAENKTPEDGAVASFAALPDTVKAQTVPTGTEESELGLPKELTAEVCCFIYCAGKINLQKKRLKKAENGRLQNAAIL